ncbi:hypothetical protein QAD02_008956 [Eretmocerus hayati]|uniref:Uncharacterized protein n=1 Tax=Eretmocerus hayati TaxID=131215 RepID=A0ACC2NAD3_9HYME|nr:hypothetical protein QAD02_008956 [Eretmocerus hayati]
MATAVDPDSTEASSSSGTQSSTSKAYETLADVLADVPEDVLTGCDPQEAFTPAWRAAAFPRSRPADVPETKFEPSVFGEEKILDPNDCFYFESDHLALKANKDYRELLRTIVTLQAQRSQAIRDLDTLLVEKRNALSDPIGYVAKLQAGKLPEYPAPQSIAELPEIEWTKYKVAQPDGSLRPQTRNARVQSDGKKESKCSEEAEKLLVRGRIYNESKPESFNRLWTVEEQCRLEKLLIEYPPEEVEMRRWTKIANALGNRTPKQVSSRVQKYFLKLTRAGLPIPGRGPKSKDLRKGSMRSKSSFRKSTFFPHEQLFDEIKREPARDSDSKMPNSFEGDSDLKQMELLRLIKNENDGNNGDSNYHHLGYKCYICGDEPIKGTRWHCKECLDDIDLCSDCAVAQLEAEQPLHPSTHKLMAIEPPKYSKCYDADYLPQNFSSTSYNYLDPNFLPE